MAIPYYLVDNPLTEDPSDYRAVLKLMGIKKEEHIVARILKNNVGISESEVLAVLKQEQSAIKEFLEDGYKVETELFSIRPTIKGVFHNIREFFSSDKHTLRIRITPQKELKEVLKKIEMVKITAVEALPVITEFEDMISKTSNETVTPGKSAKLHGDKLKFDAEDVEQGIFFVKEDNTKTRVVEYVELGIKKLIFNVPDKLPKGNYTVQVSGKTSAGELRIGRLKTVLKVA